MYVGAVFFIIYNKVTSIIDVGTYLQTYIHIHTSLTQ